MMRAAVVGLGAVVIFFVSCATMHNPTVVVQTPSSDLKTPLSEVRFDRVDLRGNPMDIVLAINAGMKQAGLPLGLTIGGQFILEKTHLKMRNATLREIIDQMYVQLRISYFDNIRLRELYIFAGEQTAFTMTRDSTDRDGKHPLAGPREFMPTEFASLPLRNAYFHMSIEDLARERGLLN